MTSEAVVASFVRAVEQHHVLENSSEGIAEHAVASSDLSSQNKHRQLVEKMIKSLDGEIQEVAAEQDRIVHGAFMGEFESILDLVKHMSREIQDAKNQSDHIMWENTFPLTGLSELEKIYEQYNQSTKRHSEIDRTVTILRELSLWFQRAESLEKVIGNQEPGSVYEDLESLKYSLSVLERKVPMIAILPKLQDQLQGLQHSATSACSIIWNRTIFVETDGESMNLILRRTEGLDSAFPGIEGFGILEHKLPELVSLFLDKFISPLLTRQFSVLTAEQTFTLHKESSTSSVSTMFTSLTIFISYISSNLHPRALRLLKPKLLPPLIEKLQSEINAIAISIPLSELHTIDNLIREVSQLDRHLTDLEWASSTPLKAWAATVPQTWFDARQAAFLNDARVLVAEYLNSPDVKITTGIDITTDPSNPLDKTQLQQTDKAVSESPQKNGELEQQNGEPEILDEDESDGWKFDEDEEAAEVEAPVDASEDTSEWKWEDDGEEVDDNDNITTTTDAFPYCISAIPDHLMDLLKKLLDEMLELSKSGSVVSVSAKKYPSTVPYILSLWRAIVRYHNTSMTRCQRIRVSNDAFYLSHKLHSFSQYPEILSEIQVLQKFGEIAYEQEQNRIILSLTSILESTNEFINCSNPEESQKCTESIQLITSTLLTISKDTRTILPPSKHLLLLGSLFSSVLLYINNCLTTLEDISSDDSTLLIQFYQSLFTLESLFGGEPGRYVPEWLRSQYIRELLEWRMVDIMEAWREGLLQGVFDREEMAGWLRKLFQGSEARERNIAEILHG